MASSQPQKADQPAAATTEATKPAAAEPNTTQKSAALEEDDEFEDFPVEGMLFNTAHQ